eukprot:scaffold127589_cov39-Phaeocystis_antarctica.AAC.1
MHRTAPRPSLAPRRPNQVWPREVRPTHRGAREGPGKPPPARACCTAASSRPAGSLCVWEMRFGLGSGLGLGLGL